MTNMDQLLKLWPMILLVAGLIAIPLAYFATKGVRQKMTSAQEETIKVYQQTILAKDGLAIALAEATAKQVIRLTDERRDSDARNEGTIAEYRNTLHSVRNQLQISSDEKGKIIGELGELRASRDFQPVMEFLKTTTEQNSEAQKQILSMLSVIAPVLERVMESLRIPSDTARKVEIVNDEEHRVPVKA